MTSLSAVADQEVLCPICKDPLIDPVTLDCGHNFCQECITKHCETWDEISVGDADCPICMVKIQTRNFRRNWQLANVVERLKLTGDELCQKHKELLHLFCKEDEELVCWVCQRSPEHKSHTMVLREEAAQEYKVIFPSKKLAKATEKIKHLELHEQGKDLCERHNRKLILFCREDIEFLCGHCMLTSKHLSHTLVDKKEAKEEFEALESWRKERAKILKYNAEVEKESQEMLKSIEMERQKVLLQFRELRRFLRSQEEQLLIKIEKVEEEIAKERNGLVARLSEKLCKMEKDLQAAREVLQNVPGMFPRYEGEPFEKPAGFPLALKWRIWEFCDINPFLVGAIKQFKETLLSGLELRKANVTLDPNTAHSQLLLSTDYKSVSWRKKRQDLSPKAERFDVLPFVLGHEGFTTGRHFWEVLVESERNWAVGVARKSVRRKDMVPFNPERGIWAVGNVVGYGTVGSLPSHHMSLSSEIKKIRVTLNCEGGRVAFHDADTAALIFIFPAASFSGETLHPFLYILGEASLRLSPEGSQKEQRGRLLSAPE